MVSGRYYQQKGVNRLEPDMFKSYNFRVKLQAEIKPWLTIASNTKFFQSNYRYYGYEDEYNNFRKPTLHALASFVPVNPDGTAVSHTSMTQSSTHYVMDGYNAMMQKGKSFGNKKTRDHHNVRGHVQAAPGFQRQGRFQLHAGLPAQRLSQRQRPVFAVSGRGDDRTRGQFPQ